MTQPFNKNLNRSKNVNSNNFVDIHCHCLPLVDDGPSTQSDSLALCQALVDDGITTVIATPHQLGRYNGDNESQRIRDEVCVLNLALQSNKIALSIVAGGDVRVDERICQLLDSDKILTLADGGKYLLLELPQETFIDIEPLLIELSSRGIEAIISHPERHPILSKEPALLGKWFAHSIHLQITSGSFLGEFGISTQKAAWYFLSSGMAQLVATDCHNLRTRRPSMSAAFERITLKFGHEVARQVCIENPLRVLKGQNIEELLHYKREEV